MSFFTEESDKFGLQHDEFHVTQQERIRRSKKIELFSKIVEPEQLVAHTREIISLTPNFPTEHCQNGRSDICLAANVKYPHVICPSDSCDIDDGMRCEHLVRFNT